MLGYSIPPLQSEAAMGHFDAVLHVGDMAYDLSYNNGRYDLSCGFIIERT